VQADSSSPEIPVEFCERKIRHFEQKADHNKIESLRCFVLVIGCTLVAPLFVTLGDGIWFGKLIPSVLSLLAAAATAWLQLRKPQQLWALYRTAQRELEDQQVRYKYRLGEFRETADPDKLLAEKVADIALSIHRQWVPLVPSPEKAKGVGEPNASDDKHSARSA
jgi:hypothetical protein